MKIIFITRLFYPHIGGVEKHVYKISKNLISYGHQVTIITENHGFKSEENLDGINIIRINQGKEDWFKKFRIWKEIWKLKKIILDSDVVHCHDIFFWYFPLKILYFNKPVYITFHGYEGYPLKNRAVLGRKLAEILSKGNICIGSFIQSWYGTKPDYISYGGADMIKNKNINNKYSAFFIGRLSNDTGINTYLSAYKVIRSRYSKFTLTVVGEGLLKKHIDSSVNYIGVKRDPKSYYINHHYAFVSGYLTILEALIAKRPVIAVYDNPLKKDYLELTPFAKFITIVNSDNEIIAIIEKYLANPELEKKKVEQGFLWAKDQTWERVSDLYLQLWGKQ